MTSKYFLRSFFFIFFFILFYFYIHSGQSCELTDYCHFWQRSRHSDIKLGWWCWWSTTRQSVLFSSVAFKGTEKESNSLDAPALLFKIYCQHLHSSFRDPVSWRKCVLSVTCLTLISPVGNVPILESVFGEWMEEGRRNYWLGKWKTHEYLLSWDRPTASQSCRAAETSLTKKKQKKSSKEIAKRSSITFFFFFFHPNH